MHPNALFVCRTPSPRPVEQNVPPRATPPASPAAEESSSSSSSLQDILEQVPDLLKAQKPGQALALLKTKAQSAAAQSNVDFQWELGHAYLGVADELGSSNRLGAFLVAPDAAGNWLKPTLSAEILSCYVGVLSSYGRMLSILQKPEQREHFIDRQGQGALNLKIQNARAKMYHAQIQSAAIFNKISQVNQNLATREFVQNCLESGRNLNIVSADQPFRQIEKDPLFEPIADATAPVRQAIKEAPGTSQFFWHNWAQNSIREFSKLPELQVANAFLPPWMVLPTL